MLHFLLAYYLLGSGNNQYFKLFHLSYFSGDLKSEMCWHLFFFLLENCLDFNSSELVQSLLGKSSDNHLLLAVLLILHSTLAFCFEKVAVHWNFSLPYFEYFTHIFSVELVYRLILIIFLSASNLNLNYILDLD